MAPPRRPTALKALSGTLRPSRENPKEPSGTPIELSDAPADLTDDQRAMWDELRALINPMRIATAADVFAFRSMVEDAAEVRTLRRSLDLAGDRAYVEETKAGPQVRMRPEVYAIPVFQNLVLKHLTRWGLTPGDRGRVSVLSDAAPKKDPIARFRLGSVR